MVQSADTARGKRRRVPLATLNNTLEAYLATDGGPTDAAADVAVDTALVAAAPVVGDDADGAGAAPIPTFFKPQESAVGGDLWRLWRDIAQRRLLTSRCALAWTVEALDVLFNSLKKHATDANRKRIDYSGYQRVQEDMAEYRATRLVEQAREMGLSERDLQYAQEFGAPTLQAAHFFVFRRGMDSQGTVAVASIYDLFRRKAFVYQTQIELSNYDQGKGSLMEEDLEEYMLRLVENPSIRAYAELKAEFRPYYTTAVTQRIFHQLDPRRRRRVRTDELMASPLLAELIEQQIKSDVPGWFGIDRQLMVYRQFCKLADGKECLEPADLANHISTSFHPHHDPFMPDAFVHANGGGCYTTYFIHRCFDVLGVSQMDYKNYLSFLLLVETWGADVSLPFFFKVLDIYGTGEVTPMIVHYFFKQVRHHLHHPDVADDDYTAYVTTEIFDIANPRQAVCIRESDLRRRTPQERAMIFAMLFSSCGFDMRESNGGR